MMYPDPDLAGAADVVTCRDWPIYLALFIGAVVAMRKVFDAWRSGKL